MDNGSRRTDLSVNRSWPKLHSDPCPAAELGTWVKMDQPVSILSASRSHKSSAERMGGTPRIRTEYVERDIRHGGSPESSIDRFRVLKTRC